MSNPNTTTDWSFEDETQHIAEEQEIAEENMEEEIW